MVASPSTFSANFRCPICQSPLKVGEKVWQCTGENAQQRQHSFDVAKQGYVNLLPVQNKHSKNPGDSDESIMARRRFLQAGFYQSLQDGLYDFCKGLLSSQPSVNWLDIGCGEGYYTERFLQLNPSKLVALDISKPAVLATAKRLKPISTTTQKYCLVASASQVPLANQAVSILTSIFSPILADEFHRLVSDQGFLVIAKPAVNHLIEMRDGLFEQIVAHDSDKFIDELAPYFALVKQTRVETTISLTATQLQDLLTMTPYAFRAQPARREALIDRCEQAGSMCFTTDFMIYGFQKICL